MEQINTSQASDIGLIRMGSAAKESPTHSTSTSSTAWRSLGLHLLWISQGDVLQNLCQATSNNERSHRNLSHSCRYHRRSWPGARVIAFWRRVLDEARVLTGSSGLLRASTGSYGLPRASAGLLRASAPPGFCGFYWLLRAPTDGLLRAPTGFCGLLRASKPLSCHLGFSFPIGCFTLGVVPRKHVEKTTENTTNMPGLQPSFVEQPDMFSCFGHTHTQKCFACFLILHLTLMLCEITYVVSK